MKHLKPSLLCLGLFVSCMLLGCATAPQSREMVSKNLQQQAPTVHGSVIVAVEGGRKTTAWTPPLISNEDFSTALIESLRKIGLFESVGASGSAVFRLETTLEDLAQPAQAFTMKVDLAVDWRLIRISDNSVLWHEKVRSTYTATVGDAFAGIKRLRIATEGAARLNIEQGLAKLAALNL